MGILVWERSIDVPCHQTKEGLVGMGGSSDVQEELSGGEWVIASGGTHDKSREGPRRGAEEPYFSTKSLSKLKNSFFAGSLGTLMYQNFDRRTCTGRMRHLLLNASRFRGFSRHAAQNGA